MPAPFAHLFSTPTDARPTGTPRAVLQRLRGLLCGVLLQTIGLVVSANPAPELPPSAVAPVAAFDLQRYAGIWYEIAHAADAADPFIRDCAHDISAVYRLAPDGSLAVLDQCVGADGLVRRRDGVVRPDGAPAHLAVSYQPALLRALPTAWSDYRVVLLDPGYRFAAVTDRHGAGLRILARDPHAAAGTFRQLAARLESRGLPARHLIPVRHPGRNA